MYSTVVQVYRASCHSPVQGVCQRLLGLDEQLGRVEDLGDPGDQGLDRGDEIVNQSEKCKGMQF